MADRSSPFTPCGYVPVRSMAVELTAGGISADNINYVSEHKLRLILNDFY